MKQLVKTASAMYRILLCVLLCMVVLTGCIGKMTPRKLMRSVVKNMTGITSFSNTVDMDIKMEDIVKVTEISMNMEMQNTSEPRAGHAKGTASLNLRGIKLDSEMEVYQVPEDGKQVTYSGMDGNWIKDTSSSDSGFSMDSEFMSELSDAVEKFRLADEPVKVEDKECYEMYGDVTGKSLMALLGSDTFHAYGLVELPDEDAIGKLSIPVTMDIYKEEKLPARIIVDMTDALNNLYDAYDETTEVNDFTIELVFDGYNHVEPIVVPEDVQYAV